MNHGIMIIATQLALSLAANGCRPADAVPVPMRVKRTTESSNQVAKIQPPVANEPQTNTDADNSNSGSSQTDSGSTAKMLVSNCKSPTGTNLERCDSNVPLECAKVDGKDYCSQYFNNQQEGRMWGPF